jgi:hypothetical protein
MSTSTILRGLAFVALCLGACASSAVNLVLNPSFETVAPGSVNGIANLPSIPSKWTQRGDQGCGFQSLTAGEETDDLIGGDFTIGSGASLPTDGTHVLISDQSPNNVSCQIYQDAAIPAGANASLTLAAGAVFRFNHSESPSLVNVSVTRSRGMRPTRLS